MSKLDKDFLIQEFKTQNIFRELAYSFSNVRVAKTQVELFTQELTKQINNVLAKPKDTFAWRDYKRLDAIRQALWVVSHNLDRAYEFHKKEIYKDLSQHVWEVIWENINSNRRVKTRLTQLKNKTPSSIQKNILNLWLSDILDTDNMAKDPKIYNLQQKIATISGKIVYNIDSAMRDPKHCYVVYKKDVQKLKGISFSLLKQGYKNALALGLVDAVLFPPDSYNTRTLLKELKISSTRREVYKKYKETNTKKEEFNNTKLLTELVKNKQRLAQLKNKANYCELVVENYFIKDREKIEYFLRSTIEHLKPVYEANMQDIQNLAIVDDLKKLNIWDTYFFKEKLLKMKFEKLSTKYSLTMENALEQLRILLEEKFNLSVSCVDMTTEGAELKKLTKNKVSAWKLEDNTTGRKGYIILDLYKDLKRKGESFYLCASERPYFQYKNQDSYSVSYIKGGFSNDKKSPTIHTALIALFHEVGHALHAFYSQHSDSTLSDNSAYSWDLIELPSQFMEQFLYDPKLFAKFLVPKSTKDKAAAIQDAASWIESYLWFNKFFDIYENLHLDLKRFELFTNYKPYSTKVVSEVLSKDIQNKFYFNFNSDYFLSDDNYKNDYGPSKYTYLLNDIMAYFMYQNMHKKAGISLEQIYRYKFNHVSHTELQENLKNDLDFTTFNINEYLVRGQEFTFLNEILKT